MAREFVTLEISSDSGVSYDMIDFAIPADSGKYRSGLSVSTSDPVQKDIKLKLIL